MKATGIVRKVDELGRIVLPIEIRRTMEIKQQDALEIFMDNDQIVLQKYDPSCVFCSGNLGLITFQGKKVCQNCIRSLKVK